VLDLTDDEAEFLGSKIELIDGVLQQGIVVEMSWLAGDATGNFLGEEDAPASGASSDWRTVVIANCFGDRRRQLPVPSDYFTKLGVMLVKAVFVGQQRRRRSVGNDGRLDNFGRSRVLQQDKFADVVQQR
jgi:hypothetical protein